MSEANIGKTHSKETKKKMSETKKGKKWWNDGCGNRKFVLECPGDAWKLGMKMKTPDELAQQHSTDAP